MTQGALAKNWKERKKVPTYLPWFFGWEAFWCLFISLRMLFPTLAASGVPTATSGITSAASDVDKESKEGVTPGQKASRNHAVDMATHAFKKPGKGLSLPEHISIWEKSEVSNCGNGFFFFYVFFFFFLGGRALQTFLALIICTNAELWYSEKLVFLYVFFSFSF